MSTVPGTQIVVDMTGVKQSMAALEPGNYPARVDEAEIGVSKSGNPKLTVTWVVTGPISTGRKVIQELSLQQQALFGLYNLLRALGWSDEALSGQLDVTTTAQELVNLEGVLVLTHDTYQGETRHRIKRVLSAGAVATTDVASAVATKEALPF